jgi:hypothetical protein
LNQRIKELISLRDDLRVLVDEWDTTLAKTPQGQRAHLLETLGSKSGIELNRLEKRRKTRPRLSPLS